jgi:hypothetical protein
MGRYRRIAILATLLTLAGCAEAPRTEPRYLHPPAAAACPAVDPGQPVSSTEPLNTGFQPVSAAVCQFEVVVRSGVNGIDGGWQWTSVQRADGPFGELVAALRTPPPTRQEAGHVCPAVAQAPMYIALIDGSGKAVIPAIPADQCGFRLRSVDEALRKLTWVTVEARH